MGPLFLLHKLESRIRRLSSEQASVKVQNEHLRCLNMQLQEQLESSKEKLQAALAQLSKLQLNADQEQVARQRWVAIKLRQKLWFPRIILRAQFFVLFF